MKKFIGIFTLEYPINHCDVSLQQDQQLIMRCDNLVFDQIESQSGRVTFKIKPTKIIQELFTEDGQYCFKAYHFYQEIWSFLVNYNYVALKISVKDITQKDYIVQFKVYLLEKAFVEQKKLLNEQNKNNQIEKDKTRERLKDKLVHQYAKESFFILFEILNLTITIKASLRPKNETQSLDQFLVESFRLLDYYQQKYLSQNLLIPCDLNKKQVNVTKAKIVQLEQQIKQDEFEFQSQNKMEQEDVNQNLFSVNEQQSYQFTICKQPKYLKNNLFSYQAQAVNWMLYREQRINAETLNLQDQKQNLNKMWSQIQISDDIDIYFNELTGQFSDIAVPSKDVKGGILADSMGLGKTICSLALILLSKEINQQQLNDDIQEPYVKKVKLQQKKANTLLVVELSVFGHWLEEIEKHTEANQLEVYSFYKPQSRTKDVKLEVYDIVITTYGVLKTDFNKAKLLYSYMWERIILDEAHVIKSKSTVCAEAASAIQAQCRWCLTGTPIQNHLEDLFSLFHFLQVETFSDYHWFNHYINKQQDKVVKFNLLHEILKPVLLRRTKQSDTIQTSLNLPGKQHFIVRVKMSQDEQKFYNTLYSNTYKYLQQHFGFGKKQKTTKVRYMHAFQLISLLRQCCDHVGLIENKIRYKTIQQCTLNNLKSEQLIKQFIENASQNLEQSLKASIQRLQQRQEISLQQNQEQELEEDDDFSVEDEFSDDRSTADEILFNQNQEQRMELERIQKELKDQQQQLDRINETKKDPKQIQKKYDGIFQKVRNEECVICSEPFKLKIKLYYLSCTHIFCDVCFEKMQEQNETVQCPLCRKDIKNNDRIKLVYNWDQQYNIQEEKQIQKQQENLEPINDQTFSKESSKINEILKYIEYVRNNNEKVVIFTQWLSIMNYIEGKIRIRGIQFRKIEGKMEKNQRKTSIKDFMEKNITVMLISLKAGAYGINLSCANHVLLVDPWWNPAVEDQAVERVHRLGQKKNVQIVSFICENTIEERVLQMHKIKRQLFKDALQLKLPDQEFSFQEQIEFVMKQKID